MTGCHRHNIDIKGRLFMPAKFRDELGDTFFITRGLDNCLSVYSLVMWKELEEKVNSMPISKSRHIQRMIFASATQCESDSQGRIHIPQNLRDYASLEKDVVIIGVSNRAEIWNAEKWNKLEETELTAENLASAMDELGF